MILSTQMFACHDRPNSTQCISRRPQRKMRTLEITSRLHRRAIGLAARRNGLQRRREADFDSETLAEILHQINPCFAAALKEQISRYLSDESTLSPFAIHGDDNWTRSSAVRLGLETTTRPRGRPKKET
jgi:hypothetical protein